MDMGRWKGVGVLALALLTAGCTTTWSGGEQTGPVTRTGCARSPTYSWPGQGRLYEGMPAPIGGADRPVYSFYCVESP